MTEYVFSSFFFLWAERTTGVVLDQRDPALVRAPVIQGEHCQGLAGSECLQREVPWADLHAESC